MKNMKVCSIVGPRGCRISKLTFGSTSLQFNILSMEIINVCHYKLKNFNSVFIQNITFPAQRVCALRAGFVLFSVRIWQAQQLLSTESSREEKKNIIIMSSYLKLSRSFDCSCLIRSAIYVWETETEVFQVIHLLTFPKWHFSLTFYSSYFDFYNNQTFFDYIVSELFIFFFNAFLENMFRNICWAESLYPTKLAWVKLRKIQEEKCYIRWLNCKRLFWQSE